jgi:hypothetical protein
MMPYDEHHSQGGTLDRPIIVRMAHLYHADLTPSKLELLAGWIPRQPWFEGDAGSAFSTVASFRLDDPDGEVGIETLLVRAGDGPILQASVTYRGAPLSGGEAWLIGTMQHSVLGERWVYDAAGDPVSLAATATTALSGGSQADQWFDEDGTRVFREPTAIVVGSGTKEIVVDPPAIGTVSTRNDGSTTVTDTPGFTVSIARVLGGKALEGSAAASLSGSWTGHPEQELLALIAQH